LLQNLGYVDPRVLKLICVKYLVFQNRNLADSGSFDFELICPLTMTSEHKKTLAEVHLKRTILLFVKYQPIPSSGLGACWEPDKQTHEEILVTVQLWRLIETV